MADQSESPSPSRARWIVGVVIYASVVALVVWGMSRGRQWAIRAYSGDAAKQQWEDWRESVKKGANEESPVERRVPKSAEPPALVLMRDYYYQCLGGALLVTSALVFSMLFLFGGMLEQGSWQPIEDR